MDIISQLNEMAMLARCSGTRRPSAFPTATRTRSTPTLTPTTPPPSRRSRARRGSRSLRHRLDLDEQPKAMSQALILAAKKFDALVSALPLSSEEDQLKRIQELQAKNEVVGLELQKQLEAAEKELKQVEVLFNEATDNCINLKKPDQ